MANIRPSGNRHFRHAVVCGNDPVEAKYSPTDVDRDGETLYESKLCPMLALPSRVRTSRPQRASGRKNGVSGDSDLAKIIVWVGK